MAFQQTRQLELQMKTKSKRFKSKTDMEDKRDTVYIPYIKKASMTNVQHEQKVS